MVFGEPSSPGVTARLRGGMLIAPALLPYELASVCLKKIRADPARTTALLSAFALWADMAIVLVEVDQQSVIELAQIAGLTSYDASYLWLAQSLGGELVTLDDRLERAAKRLTPP